MRTFVAIDIPSPIRLKIADLVETLHPAITNIRWTKPEGLHITLKFLGEVPPADVEEIKLKLASIHLATPLPVRICGAGFFPNARAPRVIWLGVNGGTELGALAGQIEETLLPLGFAKEDRAFSAHLTLGRPREPGRLAALQELLRRREPLDMGSFVANEFFLYESKPSPKGSLYLKIARFEIAPGGSNSRS